MVKMEISEVRTQTEAVKAYCQSLKEGADNLKLVTEGLVLELGIGGATGNSIKAYLSSMYPTLAKAMLLHAQSIEEANQAYVDGYVSLCGEKSLDSDVLEKQIDGYNTSIEHLATSKENQEKWYNKQDLAMQQVIQFDYRETINGLAASIATNEAERAKIQAKLDKLLEFNGQSSSYFSSVSESANLMDEGLKLLGGDPSTGEIGTGSWNGKGFTLPAGDWRSRVNDEWETREKKLQEVRNEETLKQYAKLDKNGNITDIYLSELSKLLWKAKNPEELSLEETYTLLKIYQYMMNVNTYEKFLFDNLSSLITPILGFTYNEADDYYYTGENSIQSYGGFMDMYDEAGGLFGMDLDTNIIYFEANGKEFRLQLWKGSYGFENAYGAEIGLYYKSSDGKELDTQLQSKIPGWYACVEADDQLKMRNSIYDSNTKEKLIVNDTRNYAENGDHYWNLAIKTDKGYTKDDLYTISELEVPDKEMREAMYQSLKSNPEIASVFVEGDIVSFTWKK